MTERKRGANLDQGKGLGARQSEVVHVRVSKAQAARLAKVADQAGLTRGELLRELLEMALSDPVHVAEGLMKVRRGARVIGYTVEQLELPGDQVEDQERE